MHQFLSSVFTFFLSPLHWIVILLIAAYLLRRPSVKRTLRIIAVILFLIFTSPLLLEWYAGKWQPKPVLIAQGKLYSCGIVPGGFASPDAAGNGYFNGTADRFIQALKLYKLGNISHILVCGGNGKQNKKNFQEAAFVKKELVVMGVPDSVIYVEDGSNNTADNAINANKILDSNQLKPPYLLITSAYHLPRATLLFAKAGVPTDGFPCNYISRKGRLSIFSFIPNIGLLFTWDYFLKEAAGYAWYKFK